ncbi:hypothetical protein PVMG_00044 [Plasmodium vivax Mauritania I]|uniref:G domain-containing protein n=1 Tax=Plasmodium vivax Mauritania I TaxID=1035515 RepID=A0A0J9T6S1_PLAVI|nr:hypothetical protein PVMG_00044 [Plasmodium vivax Mauritania I]
MRIYINRAEWKLNKHHRCHSYFLKNNYFENVFFVNSHIKGFSKNDEKEAVKMERNRKRGVFYFPPKSGALGRRGVYRWVRKKRGHSSTRCFFKSNGGVAPFSRNGDSGCGRVSGDARLNSLARSNWSRWSKLFSSDFEKAFKENFDESSRLKKSELVSILACICTNIVIEFLKIKEEKKTEDFDYPFDYSLMNILKLVNFEYDVNEELQKKRKKQKREFNRRKFKGGGNEPNEPHLGGPPIGGAYEETEEDVNINIDNKNTKEENDKLDEYIKMMEFNTMEIKHIEPYIDLFFGKKTFQKVFLKNGIDIHKIYDKLSEALFDKCQEKANVMELQRFVEHEERNIHKKKRVHVRNGSMSFDEYMEGLGSLEESKGVSEVERILYDGEVPPKVAAKKRKKKNRKGGTIINGLSGSERRDGDHLGVDLGGGPGTDGGSGESGDSGGDSGESGGDSSGDPGVEHSAGSTNSGSQNDGGDGHEGGQDNFSGGGNKEEGRSANRGGVEFLNGISYALVRREDETEANDNAAVEAKGDLSVEANDNAAGEANGNIVLIKFVYDNKYACEFRTDLGVIAYEGVGTKSPEDIKEGVKKMYRGVSVGGGLSDLHLIRGGPFKRILEDLNFEELYEMPYKKRFARKQSIVRQINASVVVQKGVSDMDAYPLLYGYLKVWEEDLHCYELKRVEVRHMWGERKRGENMPSGEMRWNFFRNYGEGGGHTNDQPNDLPDDHPDDVLIDSDRYRQIVRAKDGKANGTLCDLLGGDFPNSDYISFKAKLFVNNRKEINCYEELITKLTCGHSNLSVAILSRLKEIREDLSFVSGEAFLEKYTFDEEDEFFNFNRIVHRCVVEGRYHSMFRGGGGGLKGGERSFKLFCHGGGFAGGSRGGRNVFVPLVRRRITYLPPPVERALSLPIHAKVSAEESRKKKQQKRRKKKKQLIDDANLVSSEKQEDDPFSDEMDEDLLRFEKIDKIMELRGEGDHRRGSGLGGGTTDLLNDEVTSQAVEHMRRQPNRSHEKSKNYLEKMLERQKRVNDFLSLEKAEESVKKNLSVVNYEEAFKQLRGKSRGKQQAVGEGGKLAEEGKLTEDNQVEATLLSDADDEEIERQIRGILQGKNLNDGSYRLDRFEERGGVDTQEPSGKRDQKDDEEKKKEEKKKIEEFFKNMRVEVKLSRDSCVGCGIAFQSADQKKFGFLKSQVYERVVSRNEGFDRREILRDIYEGGVEAQWGKKDGEMTVQEGERPIGQCGSYAKEHNRKQELLSEVHKLRGEAISKVVHLGRGGYPEGEITSIIQKQANEPTGAETTEEKFYLCERCFNLKYKNDIQENMIINYTNKNEISAEDFEKYVINIFKKRCFIIYIVDILDLYIYSNLKKLFSLYKMHSDRGKSEGFFFCVNKVDLLPDYKEFTVKNYVYNFLRSNKINVLFRNIFLVSAKTGYNVKKLIYTAYVRSRAVRKRGKRRGEGGGNRGGAKSGQAIDGEVEGDDDDEEEVDGDGDDDEVVEGGDDYDGDEVDDDDGEASREMGDLGELAPPGDAPTKKKKFFLKNVNIYIVGNANSGKSSLINYLLKNVKKKDNRNFQISNSIIPGTTLKNIQIKLSKHITINDTPGIISGQSLLSCLNFDEMKYVVCTKLKKKVPAIYVNKNDYIFIGGLMYIHILNIKKHYAIMSFFMSERIPIIKRKNFSKDAGNFLREKISSGFLYPPFSVERFDQLGTFKDCYFNITNPCVDRDSGSYDVHVQGLGCITFYAFESIEFHLHTLKNVDVVSRTSLMPYHKRYGKLNISKGKT